MISVQSTHFRKSPGLVLTTVSSHLGVIILFISRYCLCVHFCLSLWVEHP